MTMTTFLHVYTKYYDLEYFVFKHVVIELM
jgi:hypothetical protein